MGPQQLETAIMLIDGNWNLSMKTPIGERKARLVLKSVGGALSGRLTGEEGNSTEIFDGKAANSTVAWKAAIKNPVPVTLEFSGTVEGDKMSGTVAAGAVGSWSFNGSRS
jgi:hypothetical protein